MLHPWKKPRVRSCCPSFLILQDLIPFFTACDGALLLFLFPQCAYRCSKTFSCFPLEESSLCGLDELTLSRDRHTNSLPALLIIRFLEASLYRKTLHLSVCWTSLPRWALQESLTCHKQRWSSKGQEGLCWGSQPLTSLLRAGKTVCFLFLGLPILLILGYFLMPLPWVSEHVAPLGGAIFSCEPHLFVSNLSGFFHPSPPLWGTAFSK